MWLSGPDLNRHDLNGRDILSSLDYVTTQDNPPKHKSNALLSCVKLLLDAVILTYQCQQSVSEIPPGGAHRRCDYDGYRPDTLGVKLSEVTHRKSRSFFGVMGTGERYSALACS